VMGKKKAEGVIVPLSSDESVSSGAVSVEGPWRGQMKGSFRCLRLRWRRLGVTTFSMLTPAL